MKRFKRYEATITYCLEYTDEEHEEDWDEYKKELDDNRFWCVLRMERVKDLMLNTKIENVVEGYYDDKDEEHIDKIEIKDGGA